MSFIISTFGGIESGSFLLGAYFVPKARRDIGNCTTMQTHKDFCGKLHEN
jgi:hypothetical protein